MDANPPTGAAAGSLVIEQGVLEIVSALVKELRGGTLQIPVVLASSLERDLASAASSASSCSCGSSAGSACASPRRRSRVRKRPPSSSPHSGTATPGFRTPAHVQPTAGAATAAPLEARTLLDALEWHVRATPDRVHIFLQEDGSGERPITYRALWDGARDVAAALAERGVAPGDTVALMLRTEEAFFRTFIGVLMAGAIPVPMYAAGPRRSNRRVTPIDKRRFCAMRARASS